MPAVRRPRTSVRAPPQYKRKTAHCAHQVVICEKLLLDYEILIDELRAELHDLRYQWACELCEGVMEILGEYRAFSTFSTCFTGFYRTATDTTLTLELEEWTPSAARRCDVNRDIANAFCTKKNGEPCVTVGFFSQMGSKLMVGRPDSIPWNNMLVVYPLSRDSGRLRLQGVTEDGERVRRELAYSNGWLNALREVGFLHRE